MKTIRKNNLAFTTSKLAGLLEIGVVADKFGNTLYEVVHTTSDNGVFRLYFEYMSSVIDYVKTNFK